MRKNFLTILTPTYNRAKSLKKLFENLKKQDMQNFIWVIIDDGSNDNTKETVKNFRSNKFDIKYYYKKNGGKHTAINFGLNYINTELTFIVDSDDFLTHDATKIIYNEWVSVQGKKLAGMILLKADLEGNVSGFEFENKRFIGNYNEVIINNKKRAENAEVWRSSILKKHPFPVFKGEKYIGETAIWSKIAKQYDMLFVNEIIYIYEYLEGGLTSSGRMLRIANPKGGMHLTNQQTTKEFKVSLRIKRMVLYCTYGFFSDLNLKDIYKMSNNKKLFLFTIPFGYVLFLLWNNMYVKKRINFK